MPVYYAISAACDLAIDAVFLNYRFIVQYPQESYELPKGIS